MAPLLPKRYELKRKLKYPHIRHNSQKVEEDLNYLWKLGAGSVGGGAVIKYGSALFPEIARPNLLEALLLIGMPVVLSIFLLIKESTSDSRN